MTAASGGGTSHVPDVSVVIPTFHRPASLRAAVDSVLGQDADGLAYEVVISVSDARSAADRSAAQALAEADARVRVVIAPTTGAAAARNAGITASCGAQIALLDDDCRAARGWLAAGVAALEAADLVQGRTWPAGPVIGWERTIRVTGLTWLWESCNLFVRRSAVERGGLFDADWRRTGRLGHPWGEDTEWGWRLVRNGAAYAYAPDALVHHAVDPGSYWAWLSERTDIHWFPRLVRSAPEVRRRFYRGYFFDRRHLVLTGIAASTGAGALAWLAGSRTAAAGLLGAALLAYVAPARRIRDLHQAGEFTRDRLSEAVELCCLAWGTARWRRVVL